MGVRREGRERKGKIHVGTSKNSVCRFGYVKKNN